MAVHELRSQEAQHDTGAILRSHGREAMQFELDGQVMTIEVDRGIGADLFYLPAVLTWDDGTPLSAETASLLRPVIAEVERFWGAEAQFRTLAG